MSDAKVTFATLDDLEAVVGKEQTFSFACPKHAGRRCEGLVIKGRTRFLHDPNGKNGGIAQWEWNGDRSSPTFTPSINCTACWHGYVKNGRCVSAANTDEPEPV